MTANDEERAGVMTADRETVRNRGEGRSDWDSIGLGFCGVIERE